MANASAAENQAADSNNNPIHDARTARRKFRCEPGDVNAYCDSPSQSQEIVIEVGDTVLRLFAFTCNGKPNLAIRAKSGAALIARQEAGADMKIILNARRERRERFQHGQGRPSPSGMEARQGAFAKA